MNPILDQKGNTVAYLYNKLLLDVKLQKVKGVVLGNCVFGHKAEPVGKFFNNTFRNLYGDIVAVSNSQYNHEPVINQLDILNGAWKILMEIKTHECTWIPENNEWSDQSFSEFLAARELAYEPESMFA